MNKMNKEELEKNIEEYVKWIRDRHEEDGSVPLIVIAGHPEKGAALMTCLDNHNCQKVLSSMASRCRRLED